MRTYKNYRLPRALGSLGAVLLALVTQVTFYGHLLYYFKGDTAPGQTNGVGVSGWHLIGPFGNVMLPR
jgi:Secreted repeat of unknown function